jgi:hypothetical protein
MNKGFSKCIFDFATFKGCARADSSRDNGKMISHFRNAARLMPFQYLLDFSFLRYSVPAQSSEVEVDWRLEVVFFCLLINGVYPVRCRTSI